MKRTLNTSLHAITCWESLPTQSYDSTGFGAVGAGTFGWGSYNGRLEVAAFWTTTQGEMPSAPKRRSSHEAIALRFYDPYMSTFVIEPGWFNIDGSSAENALSVRCVKNQAPTVVTSMIQAGRATMAGVEGIVVSDGGEGIVESGFCWSFTHTEPTFTDSVVVTTESMQGTFSTVLTGLETGVMYYVRAYARNAIGTSFGAVKTFSTIDAGTVTDIDNHVYSSVKIGNQVWMTENLRVSRYNDGTSIPLVNSPTAWSVLTSGARCLFDTLALVDEYGYLYNQKAVQSKKLAPVGWHVPTISEWYTLMAFLTIDENKDGMLVSRLKESGTAHWANFYANGTNTSGFTALPDGIRLSMGQSYRRGESGSWWSTSRYTYDEAGLNFQAFSLEYENYYISQMEIGCGLSVRCLKDYPSIITTSLKNVTQTTASIGAKLVEAGGVLKRLGLCWSATASLPTVNNAQVILLDSTVETEDQWLNVDTLTPGSTYYLRAFSENSTGISYGPLVAFSTPSSNTVVDLDGNQYHTIKIGTQTWMVENLKTTKYNDGTLIGGISGFHSTIPGFTIYANNNSNRDTYGLLYNWYAVSTGKLAPEGWRVPTHQDWQTLVNYLGGEEAAGRKLKESGLIHWNDPNTGAIDWGFKALPGGSRDGGSASFMLLRSRGWWWSTTPGDQEYNAFCFGLVSWMSDGYISQGYKSDAFSVRCIKE